MNRFSPQFNDSEGGINFTLGRKVPSSTNTTYYTSDDFYSTIELAESRSLNIGCTGYRRIAINSQGTVKFGPCQTSETYISLMQGMPKKNAERVQYSFDPTANVFDVRESVNDQIFNGFEYKNEIFKRSLSNIILRDPVKESILNSFQRVVFGLIETTKQIKNFVNYTVKKNNRRVF